MIPARWEAPRRALLETRMWRPQSNLSPPEESRQLGGGGQPYIWRSRAIEVSVDNNNNNSNGNYPLFPMNIGHPKNVSALAASSLQILYPIAVVLILFRTLFSPPEHDFNLWKEVIVSEKNTTCTTEITEAGLEPERSNKESTKHSYTWTTGQVRRKRTLVVFPFLRCFFFPFFKSNYHF